MPAARITLCATQTENTEPYTFSATGIRVYSWEEALFHACRHWKQSLEEPFSAAFIAWVSGKLRLPALAGQLQTIAKASETDAGRRFLRFLTLTDYFTAAELGGLQAELSAWVKRREWEKRKEYADFLLEKGQPREALLVYRGALSLEQNAPLCNNTAIAYLQLEMYGEAVDCLERALLLAGEQPQLLLNLAEAAICSRGFDRAAEALARAAELDPANADVPYLYGELNLGQGNIRASIGYLEKAIALVPLPHYVFSLADVYLRLRQYDKALAVLEQAPIARDSQYLVKQAEIQALAGNVPAAVKAMEKALFADNRMVELWTRLAMYHRQNYDLSRAQAAVTRALTLEPDNVRAQLEDARIKKSLGKTREHQAALGHILKNFKRRYRELSGGVE